jgi:hypothetical protein
MYKFGIWRPQNLANTRTTLGKARQYSYALLRMPVPSTPADIARFETVIRTVRLSSGICRTTYRSRFDDLDVVAQRVLERTYSADQTLDLHDLAASDGLLSIQWADRVYAAFPRARMTASDVTLYFTEAVSRSGEIYILEPSGTPIQYTRPPFVVSMDAPESAAYPLNVLARAWGRRRLKDLRMCSAEVRWNGVPDEQVIRRGGWTFRQIPLVHPTALSHARNGRFRIMHADAFRQSPSKYDVIRVMNLYQPTVFPPGKIHEGLRAALDSLTDGGILIAGRTIEREAQRNDASLFQKLGGRMRVLERLGKGFEFEHLVITYQYDAAATPEQISPAPFPAAQPRR